MLLSETGILAAVAMSATTAAAQDASYSQACKFTVECFEQDACAETDYDVALEYSFAQMEGDKGAGNGKAVDVAATRRAVVVHNEGAFVANAVDFESDRFFAAELFTLVSTAAGQARLITTFTDEPMVITYHGTCQGAA